MTKELIQTNATLSILLDRYLGKYEILKREIDATIGFDTIEELNNCSLSIGIDWNTAKEDIETITIYSAGGCDVRAPITFLPLWQVERLELLRKHLIEMGHTNKETTIPEAIPYIISLIGPKTIMRSTRLVRIVNGGLLHLLQKRRPDLKAGLSKTTEIIEAAIETLTAQNDELKELALQNKEKAGIIEAQNVSKAIQRRDDIEKALPPKETREAWIDELQPRKRVTPDCRAAIIEMLRGFDQFL